MSDTIKNDIQSADPYKNSAKRLGEKLLKANGGLHQREVARIVMGAHLIRCRGNVATADLLVKKIEAAIHALNDMREYFSEVEKEVWP